MIQTGPASKSLIFEPNNQQLLNKVHKMLYSTRRYLKKNPTKTILQQIDIKRLIIIKRALNFA